MMSPSTRASKKYRTSMPAPAARPSRSKISTKQATATGVKAKTQMATVE